jgi:capsular polysaccharide biosynthesis protein
MREIRFLVLSSLKELARRFGLALTIVVLGVLGGLGYGLFMPPTYSATAFVLVVGEPSAGPTSVNYAQAYARLAPMAETLAWARNGMSAETRERARASIQASSSPDTPLVRLTGSASNPARAAEFANTAANALVRYGAAHQGDTGVRVAMMTQADAPVVPSSPNLPLNVAVGTATGILLGGLVAVSDLGRRLRRLREYARTQMELERQAKAHVPAPTPAEKTVDEKAVGEKAPGDKKLSDKSLPVHAEARK